MLTYAAEFPSSYPREYPSVSFWPRVDGSLRECLPFVACSSCAAVDARWTGRRGLIGAWLRPN